MILTLEETKTLVNQLGFPETNEGDILWYPGLTHDDQPETEWGFRFTYQNDEWLYSPKP